jgi:hypothetical protein
LCVSLVHTHSSLSIASPPDSFSSAEPWLHVILGGTGAYLGSRLGATYDDTRRLMERQAAGYASLPTWAYAHLSKDELG